MKHWKAVSAQWSAASVMLLACASPQGQKPDTRPAAQELAISVGVALTEHSGELASIWEGYWGPDHLVGLYPFGSGTLVIAAYDLGRGSSDPEQGELPAALQGRATVEQGTPSGPFQLDYPYAGRRIATVQVGMALAVAQPGKEVAPWLTDPMASAVVLAAHEGFHTYQIESFLPVEGSASPLPGPDLALVRAHRTLFEPEATRVHLSSERNALRVALEASDLAETSRALGVYYSLLAQRRDGQPSGIRAFEEAQERWEGVATWVGYEAARVTLGLAADATQRHLVHDLGVEAPMSSGWDVFWRWHLYATGAAKALLLDRVESDHWQTALAGGASLDSLLHEALLPGAGSEAPRTDLARPWRSTTGAALRSPPIATPEVPK